MNTNVKENTTIHNDWRNDCLGSVVITVDERQKRTEPKNPGKGHKENMIDAKGKTGSMVQITI